MEEEEKSQEKDVMYKVKEKVEESIEYLISNDLDTENVKNLGMLVDIHKDLENEKYWKIKEELYMYRDSYNDGYSESYGRRGVPGTGRGRYRDSYGRGYRGEDALDEMSYHYGNYHNSGSYGAKEDSSYKMVEAFKKFGYAIGEELEPKDKMMFKKAMQEIMQMLEN